MTFLDTNVLVYSVDGTDPAKQSAAREIVVSAVRGGDYLISAQVLNEFSNIAILKLKLTIDETRKFVSFFSRMNVVPLDHQWTDPALALKQNYGIQFFDSLVLVAAQENGCNEILTEDLNDGQMYGSVKAVNPFKGL